MIMCIRHTFLTTLSWFFLHFEPIFLQHLTLPPSSSFIPSSFGSFQLNIAEVLCLMSHLHPYLLGDQWSQFCCWWYNPTPVTTPLFKSSIFSINRLCHPPQTLVLTNNLLKLLKLLYFYNPHYFKEPFLTFQSEILIDYKYFTCWCHYLWSP